ncbi:MAG: DUF4126 domain-containing protein [Anaerolineales bacterium]|nr:DUF4126 domain-containing protein [Anaerolineales bacterium]
MDIFTAFGLSASAGLNAYIPLLVIALLARFTDLIRLNAPWDAIESWWVIAVLVVLSIIEFFADKVPAVNHVNDMVQTFVRPAAGAVVFLASSGAGETHPVLAATAGILVAGSVHVAKSAAVRPAVTAATGGTANVPVSILEDIASTLLSILAVVIPVLVAAIAIPLVSLLIWWFWRRAKRQNLVQ